MTATDRSQQRARPARRRTWPRWLAGAYAVVTLAAVVAWATVGDEWWLQPVNLTTFWWSLAGLVLAVVAVAARRPVAAGFLAVPGVLFLWSYGTLFVPSPMVPGDLRVVSQNLYVHAPGIEHVADLAERESPDVLVLQEVLPRRADELVAHLGETFPHRWFGDPGDVGGVAVLSRHPIVDTRPVPPVFQRSRPTAVVVIEVDGQPVQVVPVHLISPCPTCGESPSARVDLEGDVRAAEIAAVLSVLDPDLPAIVAGDLNSTDRSEPYRALTAAGFRDPQRERGSGPGFTWPAHRGPGALVRIDWVLVRGLEPTRAIVGPPDASDHRAVIVDLDLDPDDG